MSTKNKPETAAAAPEAPQDISEAYDIKNVDFRNLLTVAVGRLSNQTGESFDSATLRGKCADEILRRYEETRAIAAKLAEAGNKLASLAWSDASDDELAAAVSEWKSALAQFEKGAH
jgi:hypothetical protein